MERTNLSLDRCLGSSTIEEGNGKGGRETREGSREGEIDGKKGGREREVDDNIGKSIMARKVEKGSHAGKEGGGKEGGMESI